MSTAKEAVCQELDHEGHKDSSHDDGSRGSFVLELAETLVAKVDLRMREELCIRKSGFSSRHRVEKHLHGLVRLR